MFSQFRNTIKDLAGFSKVCTYFLNPYVLGLIVTTRVGLCSTDKSRSMATVTRRLPAVQGFDGRQNDVIFCGGISQANRNVVFFGGDVQDFPENMEAHRDNHRYKNWNLEATAELLQKRFVRSHVWVVRPKEMQLKTFSVFSNFLPFSDLANPVYSEDYGSWKHLQALLTQATEVMNSASDGAKDGANMCDTEAGICSDAASGNPDVPPLFSPKLPVVLVGFSKGCVVLNQLLHELGNAKSDPETEEFIKYQLDSMFWLDGGHNGGKDTWVTQEDILRHLVGTNVTIYAHVTPYQVEDPMRKWIKKEQKQFVKGIRKLGIAVTNVKHFEGEERDIERHFEVLLQFRKENDL